jgi:hypothetical protein
MFSEVVVIVFYKQTLSSSLSNSARKFKKLKFHRNRHIYILSQVAGEFSLLGCVQKLI